MIGVNKKARDNIQSIKHLFIAVMAENFPNIDKKSDIQISKAWRTPNSYDQSKSTPRHIIKIPEIYHKSRTLKAVGERKQITYKGKTIRTISDFGTDVGVVKDFRNKTLTIKKLLYSARNH